MTRSFLLMMSLVTTTSSFAAFNESPNVLGAYETGAYRNLFLEIGKDKGDIQEKLETDFNRMFYGTNTERLYYDFDNDESYIKTIDSDDIRSEGLSWGMMVAVQMDKKDEFDRLWRFAYNRMKNLDGTYAWNVRHQNGQVIVLDSGSAPDGEEYIATALFNAAGRWGNGIGELDYEARANELLVDIKAKLMHPTEHQIVFAPSGQAAQITDPSYHLPAFYSYWADVAESDNVYWSDVAAISRDFLQNHLAQGNGGLASYQANFDGTTDDELLPGMLNPANVYEGDAWRVLMNIGMDAHLFGAQFWHLDTVNNAYYFFHDYIGFTEGGICENGYSQRYLQNGADYGTCAIDNWTHAQGQRATNAAAAFASTNALVATDFLNALWNDSWPTGEYRYYHGSLKMLGMLHASGNFKLYKLDTPQCEFSPTATIINIGKSKANQATGKVKLTFSGDGTDEHTKILFSFDSGNTVVKRVKDTKGRAKLKGLAPGDYTLTSTWEDGTCQTEIGRFTIEQK